MRMLCDKGRGGKERERVVIGLSVIYSFQEEIKS